MNNPERKVGSASVHAPFLISQETIASLENPVWVEISRLCNLARVAEKGTVSLLTPIERKMLFFLAARFNSQDREGKFRRYHEIVEIVWQDDIFPYNRMKNLKRYISSLRRKLELNDSSLEIVNVRKSGYFLRRKEQEED